jgi:hypothetical protein
MPVESAMSTRKDMRFVKNTGKTRSGLDAMLSSSRFSHEPRAGGSATKKLAEMSSASRVLQICGRAFVRKPGTAFGVLEEPTSKCVVPVGTVQ